MRNIKLAAFTLAELTIAMLVTAVIMTMVIGLYLSLERGFRAFDDKQYQRGELIRLDLVIKKDLIHSKKILADQDGFSMIKNDDSKIIYSFSTETVTRISERRDTFKVTCSKPELRFEKYLVDNGEMHLTEKEAPYIDDIRFSVILDKQGYPMQYQRIYSAKDLYFNN